MTPLGYKTGTVALIERRRCARYAVQLPATVWVESDDGHRCSGERRLSQATIRNVSATGLLLTCAQVFPAGTCLWIRIRLGRTTHYVKGAARRAGVGPQRAQMRHECGVQVVRCPQSARFLTAVAGMFEQAAEFYAP